MDLGGVGNSNSNGLRNSRVGLNEKDGRNYVSHSPQPYSKFKLQPTKNNLMVYGQKNGHDALNLQVGKEHTEGDTRTLNPPNVPVVAGRNQNGYPVSSFDNNNQLSKNSVKNIERYSKGSFVHHSRRGKAHSNNPNAAS